MLKVLAFFLVWLGLWLPIAIPLAFWLKWRPPQPIAPAQKLPLLASLYLLAPLVLWGVVRLEDGSFADYGLSWAMLQSAGVGLALGALGLLSMFAAEAQVGWLVWQPSTPAGWGSTVKTLTLTLLLGVWVSFTEELIFRGFLLNQFQQGEPAWTLSAWLAGAIVSVIFAVLHLVWEGRENLPQMPGLWLMGLVLVVARWVDHNQLGLAWGLHAGWIWAIASLETTQVIRYTDRASPWLIGWGGKPIAGLVGILALLLTGVVVGLGAGV
ncbi:CPBP family intramembrane metalloprotease [Phormidium tenue FACHB-886]|nr:CPBP family intramembrane metalloprotease [Phormidium tenue FACHB-886]